MADTAASPHMPGHPVRRKILIGAAALIVVALAAAGFVVTSVPTSSARLQRLFIDEVQATSGLATHVAGDGTLVLLPTPHIHLTRVDMADEAHAIALQADDVRVDLRLWPLLFGRLDVASVWLDKPRFEIALDRRPIVRTGVIAQVPDDGKANALGLIHIADGEAVLTRSEKPDLRLKAVDGVLEWRRIDASANVSATFTLNNQVETLQAWLAGPARVLRGGTSPMRIRLEGIAATAALNGSIDTRGSPRYAGRVVGQTPELRLLLQSIGVAQAAMPDMGDCTINTDVAIGAEGATLSRLKLHVAGNDFEGSLAIASGAERPALAGTLAAATLDLEPLIATFPPYRGADGSWATGTLDFSGLDIADVDLRISTGHTRIARTDIADAALSLMVRARALDLNLAEGRIDNGAAKGRLTMTPNGAGVDVQANGSFTGADFADLLKSSVSTGLAGRLAGTFNIAARGASVADLIAGAHGRSDFTVHNGRIGGIDLEQNLRRLEKSEGATRVRFGGTTSFDLARVGLDVADGAARLDGTWLAGPGARMTVTGEVDLAKRTLDLTGMARRAGTDGGVLDGPQLDIHLAGPWRAPVFDAIPLPNGPHDARPESGGP